MLKKLLVGTLLAGSSMFAGTHFSVGIGVGGYGYVPPPPVVYAAPPPYAYVAPYPGPGYSWTNGYWYTVGPRRLWRNGYWAPYRSYRVAPYGRGYVRGGYVRGYRR